MALVLRVTTSASPADLTGARPVAHRDPSR